MRDFYKAQLVDAVLAGRELTLRRYTEYYDEKPIHRTGITTGGWGGPGHEYIICRWLDDKPNDRENYKIDFQEAIELVEEHFP